MSDPIERAPVRFVGHGAPTLAVDADKGADLTRWAAAGPRPAAYLIVSAHWERAPISIGAVEHTELVYDFYGFPDALYGIRYAPPGAPALADRVEALLRGAGADVARTPDRFLDHGAWVPLLHMAPAADVPVLQVSMPRSMSSRALFTLGQRLAPLRDEGVVVLGSGNVTHNLRALDRSGGWSDPGSAPPGWAVEFDAWVQERLLARDWDALLDAGTRAPAFATAHPTPDHWRPLLVALGAASDATRVTFPIEGFEFGSLSRRCVELA